MSWLWSILIIPGLIAAYFMFLRKELSSLPALKKFYAQADGFWAKVWAICGKSLTVAWSYLLMLVGGILNQLSPIAATLGDPNFKDQVQSLLHADPKYIGYFAMLVSAFTIAARLKSITDPSASPAPPAPPSS